jgi:hypothetical protein
MVRLCRVQNDIRCVQSFTKLTTHEFVVEVQQNNQNNYIETYGVGHGRIESGVK